MEPQNDGSCYFDPMDDEEDDPGACPTDGAVNDDDFGDMGGDNLRPCFNGEHFGEPCCAKRVNSNGKADLEELEPRPNPGCNSYTAEHILRLA